MLRALLLIGLVGCVVGDPDAHPQPPPPAVEYPTVWFGPGDADNPYVFIMAPAEYRRLVDQIHSSEIWMRQASALLNECGVPTTP